MIRLVFALALACSVSACVVATPYAYSPAPAYGYAYIPAYYAPPAVVVGVGGYGRGWYWR